MSEVRSWFTVVRRRAIWWSDSVDHPDAAVVIRDVATYLRQIELGGAWRELRCVGCGSVWRCSPAGACGSSSTIPPG